jgi:hypothetical protein
LMLKVAIFIGGTKHGSMFRPRRIVGRAKGGHVYADETH